jgi:60 kDa SS-A/Ro ribonucleoprotein
MAKNIYSLHGASRKTTPQNQPIPGRENEMAQNAHGGYVFTVDKWTLLERFLILGSENPAYYASGGSAEKLTREHAKNVIACLKEDGKRTVDVIAGISDAGRAPKNDPALFALALAMSPTDSPVIETRQYAASKLPVVARTGTHLFSFISYATSLRGWGAVLARAVKDWYAVKSPRDLAYQLAKYQQREGWAQRDILRLAHPKPEDEVRSAIYRYAAKGEYKPDVSRVIDGVELAKKATSAKEVIKIVSDYGLTREMIPTQFLNDATVQEALLQKMPLTAMIRNLGNMSKSGLLVPLSDASKLVTSRLRDAEYLRRSRVHPLQVLLAYGAYGAGHGQRGNGSWPVVPAVVDALMDAFYGTFANVEPTGQNLLVGIDLSGSMTMSWNGTALTHAMIAAAQAMVFIRTEKNYDIRGFDTQFVDLKITAKDTLETATKKANRNLGGGTNCSLPMIYGIQNKLNVDCFTVITDSETWAGNIQPSQALVKYRKERNKPNAKLAVIATAATPFSIADPKDMGMMDFVGFDANVPVLLADFMRGGTSRRAGSEDETEATTA